METNFVKTCETKSCLCIVLFTVICLVTMFKILNTDTSNSTVWYNMVNVNVSLFMEKTRKLIISQLFHHHSPSIPHILHQTWDSHKVPVFFKSWIKSWIKHHPHWQYWFWTPKEVRALLQKYYPAYVEMYDNYPEMIRRADVMRYFIMERYGGVYVDLDMQCLRNIDRWTQNYSCFVSKEPYEHAYLVYNKTRPGVMNTMIACRPNHPFFNITIQHLPEHAHQDILRATGPDFLDNCYLEYIAKTKNKNISTTDFIAAVEPGYFLPMYDYNHMFYSKYHNKLVPSNLTEKQRSTYDDLVQRNFTNVPRSFSYGTHHWWHVWSRSPAWIKHTLTVDIKEVVAHVTIPTI